MLLLQKIYFSSSEKERKKNNFRVIFIVINFLINYTHKLTHFVKFIFVHKHLQVTLPIFVLECDSALQNLIQVPYAFQSHAHLLIDSTLSKIGINFKLKSVYFDLKFKC